MDKQKLFDEICGVAFVNVFSLSKCTDRIVISPFNHKNKEHLFLVNVAKGVGAVNGKAVALDTSRFRIWRMNKGLVQECKYEKGTRSERETAINPIILLDFMRKWAGETLGVEDFNFGEIYDAFYSKKEDE